MAKRKEINAETRNAIVTLRKEGRPLRNIAKKLQVSYKGVQCTLKRYQDTGSLEDKSRSGRPKITSVYEDVRINVICKRNEELTASEICDRFNENRPKPVSLTTVKRRLVAAGLNDRVAIRKPLLSSKNHKKRSNWLKDCKNNKITDEPDKPFADRTRINYETVVPVIKEEISTDTTILGI